MEVLQRRDDELWWDRISQGSDIYAAVVNQLRDISTKERKYWIGSFVKIILATVGSVVWRKWDLRWEPDKSQWGT